jgi:TrmH family RNA methyltransferase
MTSKTELKQYSSLLKKKFRDEQKKFLIEGKKLVEEALNSNYSCEIILLTTDFSKHYPDFFKSLIRKNYRVEVLRNQDFGKISETVSPQGIAAVIKQPENKKLNEKNLSPFIVYLENISDPGNLGTIIRTCDWFGINTLVLSENTVEVYNPKVIRSSMGSIFHLNIFSNKKLSEVATLKDKGYKFICADLDGTDIYIFNPPEKSILFFCNESSGPSPELLSLSDEKITIPRKGKAESLNVASASAIVLSVITRRMQG